jgi:HEAT repeat protein
VVEDELARLEAQRADWVREAPKPSTADRAAAAAGANGLTTLLEKVEEARVAKRGSESRKAAPSELVDDVSLEDLDAAEIALRVLGMVRAEGARARLEPMVRDASPELRSAARQGLAFLGAGAAELVLPELIDGTQASRLAVAQALADSGPDGRARLIAFLPKLGGDRAPVLEALLHHEVPAPVSAELVPLLETSPGEAALVATLLARSGVRAATESLAKELEDPTLGPRREFLRALGELGDSSHAPLIARDLFHDSPDVRAAAAEALSRVGTPDQAEQLNALKGDYHRRVREAAAAALAHVQGKQG